MKARTITCNSCRTPGGLGGGSHIPGKQKEEPPLRSGSFRRIVFPMVLLAGACTAAWGQPGIPLRVTIAPVSVNNIPFILALEEGIYQKNGLAVELSIPPGAAETAKEDGVIVNPQYVRSGATSSPLTTANGVGLIFNRTRSASAPEDLVILATLDPVMHFHIVAQPEIRRVEQLKGKRLGITGFGAVTHFVARVFVERMQWDPVDDISLMLSGASVAALKNRRVDALLASDLRYALATAGGYTSLLDISSWNAPLPGAGVTASRSWLRDNPEAARRFMRSLVEAIAVMKKDKEATYRAIGKWWGITDPRLREMIYAAAAVKPSKPYPAVAGIRRVMEVYDSNEMRKYKPEDFYDDSLVRELDQSGFIDGLYR